MNQLNSVDCSLERVCRIWLVMEILEVDLLGRAVSVAAWEVSDEVDAPLQSSGRSRLGESPDRLVVGDEGGEASEGEWNHLLLERLRIVMWISFAAA